MWSNGTVISKQARRALEHERVTIVSHVSGYIHLLYPEATIDPAAYSHFADRLKAFLVPPQDAADTNLVEPRLPETGRVRFIREDEPLEITPEMEREEITSRLDALRNSNRAAALAPYAGHELGQVEAAPFIKAALERSPVSLAALKDKPEKEVVAILAAMANESIYDGPSRLAQPDEAWNFGRGDGLEKCLLAANVLGGNEISVQDGIAKLHKRGRTVCAFATCKAPRERIWKVKELKS